MGTWKFELQTTDILDVEGNPTGETTSEYVKTYIKDEADLAADALHAEKVIEQVAKQEAALEEEKALFLEQVTEETPESLAYKAKLDSKMEEKVAMKAEWTAKKEKHLADREAKLKDKNK